MIGAYGGFSGAEIKCVVDMVMEKKFVEYIKAKDSSHKPSIDENDFEEAVKELKDSVMANQQSVNYLNQELRRPEEWTNIERIIEMQKKYKFKDASEKSSEKTEIIPTLKEEEGWKNGFITRLLDEDASRTYCIGLWQIQLEGL